MKALIAAGGRATRLRPITWTTNKHLIPLANKPMLEHVIRKIADAGIVEIGINVNPGELEIMSAALGDGSRWGVRLTYIEQQGGAKGVAHVVANARDFLGDEPFLFYLGDNIILGSIKRFVERFTSENMQCLLAFSRVKDPQRFGVPEFDASGKLLRVIEKPSVPPSQFAVTGIYLFDKHFFEAFQNIQPSARGEYEITDVQTWLLQQGHHVGWEEITGWWKDTGTPAAMLEGNASILADIPHEEFVQGGDIDETSSVQGRVHIGEGAKIGPNCLIRGPVSIGEGAVLENVYVGPYTSIGKRCVLKNCEIEHSIVFDDASIMDTPRVIDSLIGYRAFVTNAAATSPRSAHRMVVGDNSYVEL